MKTLYVSDLDGTLLRSDETLSEYTSTNINELVNKGLLFSYATARSYQTAHIVTQGLKAKIPLITYNGAFIIDNQTKEVLLSNYFDYNEITNVLNDLIAHDIYPIVYSYINNEEKFSYIESQITSGMKQFIDTRRNDPRHHKVKEIRSLYEGNIFYITCIDDEEKLKPFYQKYKDQYHCIFQRDIYSHEQWLEILPQSVSKAHAIKQLKEYLHCDKVIAFGDGKNDIEMFQFADECYAVENAVDELKEIATAVIGDNDHDGVVKWLMEKHK